MFTYTESGARSVRARRMALSTLSASLTLVLCTVSTSGDCPPSPTTYENGVIEGFVGEGDTTGENTITSSIGMQAEGRFLIAWNGPVIVQSFPGYNRLLVHRFDADGVCICGEEDDCPGQLSVEENGVLHIQPSVAVSPEAYAAVRWLGGSLPTQYIVGTVLGSSFDFDLSPFEPPTVSPPSPGAGDHHPSAGISDYLIDNWHFYTVAWCGPRDEIDGLWLWDAATPELEMLAECATSGYFCFYDKWDPCVAMRADGIFAVAWAAAEVPTDMDSPFDIKLQLFDTDGEKIGNELTVNQPISSQPTSEESPAVAFDAAGHLVLVWTSREPQGCAARRHIWARRLHWNDSGTPDFKSNQFIVDSDSDWAPIDAVNAHPTVALSMDSESPAFIIAWNTTYIPRTPSGAVHAQYFNANGAPVGREFQVHQNYDPDIFYALANSGQHTAAYSATGEVVLTWSQYDGEEGGAYFTILPAGFAATTGSTCCKGDIDGNGVRNGLDIQPFVDLLLQPEETRCWSIVDLCPADMDSDGDVDLADIGPFVQYLLQGASCQEKSSSEDDCNSNGVGDLIDIGTGNSADCNGNFIPDECDIASQTSTDLNENGVPDECEPDCNQNDVPDDLDIADETSNDVNSNGIPDECEPDCNSNDVPDAWDISQETSADCNTNGIPDECEQDCNGNGVPDDCDIDPNDPDGNEEVSPDCNGNQRPDECDIAMGPPWGSLDCNDNDIPDECDLADCSPEDPSCQDCNENGFLDACDIAAEISLDENENGIPDECESENRMGGGGGMMQGEGMFGNDDLFFGDPEAYWAAWDEYFDWAMRQGWGPNSNVSGAEQFRAMADKLRELGLPLQDPWMPR